MRVEARYNMQKELELLLLLLPLELQLVAQVSQHCSMGSQAAASRATLPVETVSCGDTVRINLEAREVTGEELSHLHIKARYRLCIHCKY